MAAFTLMAKTALVNILLCMTDVAAARKLVVMRELAAMTTFAGQILVFSLQREFRLYIMVELPQFPGIGVVAQLALPAEGLLMRIIVFVAFDTCRFSILEPCIEMAFFTGCGGMQSK